MANRFWQDGYLVLEDFFNDQLMDQYNGLILDRFGESPEFLHNKEFLNQASTDVIPWFPQQEGVTEFDAVENDQRLNQLTEVILGDGWYSDYSMVMYSGQGTKGQSWHQDCPPDDTAKFNMNRLVYSMDITTEIDGQFLFSKRFSQKLAFLIPSDFGSNR